MSLVAQREGRGVLDLYYLQRARVETEEFQDGGRDLRGRDGSRVGGVMADGIAGDHDGDARRRLHDRVMSCSLRNRLRTPQPPRR